VLAEPLDPEPEDSTLLEDADFQQLIPSWPKTRSDLNLVEAINIDYARQKYFGERYRVDQILDDLFLKQLHKDMFGEVWRWAGKYRAKDLNLGVSHQKVAESVRNLIDDVRFWLQQPKPDLDIVCTGLHHRLVAIHPFINGNGRHSRFVTDLLLTALGQPVFSWGGFAPGKIAQSRSRYIGCLKAADNGDLTKLLAFVRSS
jgi:Fic-DOC domain mobile mystery protein B